MSNAPRTDAIAELARIWRRHEGDPDGAIRALTETASRALGVARASVWLLDELSAGLVCVELYEAPEARHGSGPVLRAFEFPAYFAAMVDEDTLAVDDTEADPRTAELVAPYLRPLGIGAILVAPIRIGLRLVGVLCHEHVGPRRAWTAAARRDAAFLASLASLTLELKSRPRREALLAATLESAEEGILATDDSRVIAFNRRFVEMWRIDTATMRSLDAVRRHIGARTGTDPAAESGGLLILDDGRVFERTSKPQRAAGRVVGRVWTFRDVTAERRAEAAQKRRNNN